MKAHGETIVTFDGKIIEAIFIGSFNASGVQEYAEKIQLIVNELAGAPFAMLVDDLKLVGGTPEAYAELDAYNRWLNTKPLIAKAMIMTSVVNMKIIDVLTPALKEQNMRQFEKRDEALCWLNTELDKVLTLDE